MGNSLFAKYKIKKIIPANNNYNIIIKKSANETILNNNSSISTQYGKKIMHTNNTRHDLDLYVRINDSKSSMFLQTLIKNGGKHTFNVFDDNYCEEPTQQHISYNFNILKTETNDDLRTNTHFFKMCKYIHMI